MSASEMLDLCRRNIMEDSTRFRRPVAERYRKATARLQERQELSKCARPFGRRDVHPNRTQQNQVKREAKAEHLVEPRQAVLYPPYGRGRVQAPRLGEHLWRRIDRHDLTPRVANQAASRPLPHPTSSASAGPSGRAEISEA